MPREELKPCPFCGGLLGTGDDSQGHTDDCYIVLMLRRENDAAKLAAAWNRRAAGDAAPELTRCPQCRAPLQYAECSNCGFDTSRTPAAGGDCAA